MVNRRNKELSRRITKDALRDFAPRKIDRDLIGAGTPIHQKIPKKRVLCPQCDGVPEITGKVTIEGHNVFLCKNCDMKFSQYSKNKAVCNKFQRLVEVIDCIKCPLMPRPISKDKQCVHFGGSVQDFMEKEGWERR